MRAILNTRPIWRFGLSSLARVLVFAWVAASLGCGGVAAQAAKAPPAKAMAGEAALPAIPADQFEQWVFQGHGNAANARRYMGATLALHVTDIDRACQLTDEQKHKLELAGRVDIKRFFDRYEKVRQHFQLPQNDEQRFQQLQNDRQRVQEIKQEVGPLQTGSRAGLFVDDSLFRKVLRSTVSEEQQARYAAVADERRAFRHRASVELAVALFEQALPLKDSQRQAFVDLVAKHTKPPRRSDEYDFYLLTEQIGRIPDDRIKPLFDDAQWKVLEKMIAQHKGVAPALRQSGRLPKEDDEDEKGAEKVEMPPIPDGL